jgi:hypothetical protein
VTGQGAKPGERGGALWIAELGAIAARELGVPVGIVAVPFPQLGGGRDLFAPVVKAGPLLAETPRPEPVDEHSLPIIGLWRVVHPTDLRMHCPRHPRLLDRSHPLSIRRLIVGGFLDGELGRRVCLKACIRDGYTAADRAAVATVFDPLESPIERREPGPETGGHSVVDALLRQRLRRIRRIAFGLMVICTNRAEIGQQLLNLRTLRVQ